MKLMHQTVMSLAFSMTAILSLLATPAVAHNGEHHDSEPSNPTTKESNPPIPSKNAVQGATVRKNVVDMTPEEIKAFIDALYGLKNTIPEGSQVSLYDQFAATHLALMTFEPMQMLDEMGNPMLMPPTAIGPAVGASPAHGNDAFLPWHREFTRRFEVALQSIDPTVTIPYWDWTDPKALDMILQPNFMGSRGEGSINIPGAGVFPGGPVSGNFSPASGWVLNNNINLDFAGQPRGNALTRFVLTPPTTQYPVAKSDEDKVLSYDSYDAYQFRDPQFKDNPFLRNTYTRPSFRPALEGWFREDDQGNLKPGFYMHNYIHGLVGGQILAGFDPEGRPIPLTSLGTLNFPSAPYDPVFWLVHSNIDRLWAQWQTNGHAGSDYYPSEGQPYGHNLSDRMWPWDGGDSVPGMFGSVDLLPYLPTFASNDIVTPADTLDIGKYGYTYDTLKTSVPEPSSALGLLGLGAFGFGVLRQRQRKPKSLSYLLPPLPQEAELVEN
jgi:tyrosinase